MLCFQPWSARADSPPFRHDPAQWRTSSLRHGPCGDARLAFDTKCDDYIHARPDLVPASIDVTEYDKDGAAWGAVNRIIAKVNTVVGELTDTAMVIGSDRLDADLQLYASLGFAARIGAPGAQDIHDDLKTTYPGRRTPRTPPTPPTP